MVEKGHKIAVEFWKYFKLELSMGREGFTEINWKFKKIYSNL